MGDFAPVIEHHLRCAMTLMKATREVPGGDVLEELRRYMPDSPLPVTGLVQSVYREPIDLTGIFRAASRKLRG